MESLEYIQQTANQILKSIGAGDSSAPPQPSLDESEFRSIDKQKLAMYASK